MKRDELVGELEKLKKDQELLSSRLKNHGERITELGDILTKGDLMANPGEIVSEPAENIQQAMVPKPVEVIPPKPEVVKVAKKARDMRKVEMDFGKVWFVRMGIVSLLTGLVFLSNFAYQNYIASWGAGARLTGLYSLAVCLLGLGAYLEKAKKAVSNYGKVLGAGGIAILYYASYAAYHIERLKVIESPLSGGLLLFLSAAVCLVYALWKRSNITAVFSIALAFYSTSINPVGGFTLFSSLILTATGLYLLYKLRSASIGFTTMLGAYLSFAYWQFFVNVGQAYSHANWFVLGYWILCTAAVLLPRLSVMVEKPLLTYVSLNNALFFLTFCIDFETMRWVSPLWPIAAVFGLVLLGLSVYTQRRAVLPESVSLVLLGKGIAMITLALCLKLTGPSLALSLIVQGGLALTMGFKLRKDLLVIAASLSLALGYSVYMYAIDTASTAQHLVVAVLFMGIISMVHFTSYIQQSEKWKFRGIGAVASLLAILFAVTLSDLAISGQVITLLVIMLASTGLSLVAWSQYGKAGKVLVSFREFSLLSHLMTVLAFVLFTSKIHFAATANEGLLITGLLAISATIQIVKFKMQSEYAGPTVYLALASFSLLFSLTLLDSFALLVVAGSLLPLALCFLNKQINVPNVTPLTVVIYVVVWLLGCTGYVSYQYLAYPVSLFIFSVVPLVHYGLIRGRVLLLPTSYGEFMVLVSGVLLLFWQVSLVGSWQVTVAISALLFLYVEKRRWYTSLSVMAGIYSLLSLITLLDFQAHRVLQNYFVALIPMAGYFLQRVQPKRDSSAQALKALALYASLSISVITSIHVYHSLGSSALSICWALLGMVILSIGFLTRDIVFRTVAFAILGLCILRVYGVDVWKLTALWRILSFITLGIVLLTTGYLYCRKVDDEESQS